MNKEIKTKFKSEIDLADLYFSKFYYENMRKPSENCSVAIEYKLNYSKTEDDLQKVVLLTTLKSENDGMKLELETVGIFGFKSQQGMSPELVDDIMRKNTVAIMFPYVRSQISLLTCQPGVSPIIIPPLNINALVEELKNK